MIYTSNYDTVLKYPELADRLVSIAQHTHPAFVGPREIRLAPPMCLVECYKRGIIDQIKFEKDFRKDVLDHMDARELAKELDNKILLCYEPKGEFCHRQIVAQWFKEHGVMCSEWEVGCEEDQCENL